MYIYFLATYPTKYYRTTNSICHIKLLLIDIVKSEKGTALRIMHDAKSLYHYRQTCITNKRNIYSKSVTALVPQHHIAAGKTNEYNFKVPKETICSHIKKILKNKKTERFPKNNQRIESELPLTIKAI